jgi:hypothetical protein
LIKVEFMVENHRWWKVWQVFTQNPNVELGLAAGFSSLTFGFTPYVAYASGNFTVSWPVTKGFSYQVEYAPDLIIWAASPGFVPATNSGIFDWVDPGPPATVFASATASARFYQVFQLGP